jgi:hypothetical protein
VLLSSFFEIIHRSIGGASESFYIDRNGIACVSRDNNINGLLIPKRKSGRHSEPVQDGKNIKLCRQIGVVAIHISAVKQLSSTENFVAEPVII